MIYTNLKIKEIKKVLSRWGDEIKEVEIQAQNETHDVTMKCPIDYIGTYKNDNIKKMTEQLKVDQVVDLVEGEQGWGINLNPKRKQYYSQDTYFMPDEFEVSSKKIGGQNVSS